MNQILEPIITIIFLIGFAIYKIAEFVVPMIGIYIVIYFVAKAIGEPIDNYFKNRDEKFREIVREELKRIKSNGS